MSIIQPKVIKRLPILSENLKNLKGSNITRLRRLESSSYSQLLNTVKPFNKNLFKIYEDDYLIETSSYTISYVSNISTMENKIAKVYSKRKIEEKKLEEMVAREIVIHQSDREHRFLAKLEGIYQNENELILIFEVGSILVNQVKKQIISSYQQWQNLMVFKIQSLCYINSFGISLCGEFSNSNFLYDENSQNFKMFNIGKNWKFGDINKQRDMGEPINSRVDVFKLGKLIYESLKPFMKLPQFDEDDDPEELLNRLKEFQLDPILVDWFSCLLQSFQRDRIGLEKLSFHEFLAKFYQENPEKSQNLDAIYEKGEMYNTNRLLFKPKEEITKLQGQSEGNRRQSIQQNINFEKRGSFFTENSINERASFFLNERPQTADIDNRKPRKSILHLLQKKSGFKPKQKNFQKSNKLSDSNSSKNNAKFKSIETYLESIEDYSSGSTMQKYQQSNNGKNDKKQLSRFQKEKLSQNLTVKNVTHLLRPKSGKLPNKNPSMKFSSARKDKLIQSYKQKKKRRDSPEKQNMSGFFGSIMGMLGCGNAYS